VSEGEMQGVDVESEDSCHEEEASAAAGESCIAANSTKT